MERILVATELAESSRGALRAAMELSRRFKAPMRVLLVAPKSYARSRIAKTLQLLDTRRLEVALEEFIREEVDGPEEDLSRIERKIGFGDAAEVLLAEAKSWTASLMVAGTHCRSALQRLLHGSVSARLSRSAAAPVLVAPPTSPARPKRILAAVDTDSSIELVLRSAAAWQETFDAQLTVVHVFAESRKTTASRAELDLGKVETEEEQIRVYVDSKVHAVFDSQRAVNLRFLRGRPDLELRREVWAQRADLLILGAHERNSLFDIHNTVTALLDACPCQVLVLHPPSLPVEAMG